MLTGGDKFTRTITSIKYISFHTHKGAFPIDGGGGQTLVTKINGGGGEGRSLTRVQSGKTSTVRVL